MVPGGGQVGTALAWSGQGRQEIESMLHGRAGAAPQGTAQEGGGKHV